VNGLYIHIGYPKTGTSFLQREIFPKVEGINYIRRKAVREQTQRIRSQDEFSFDDERTRAEIQSHFRPGTNVISNETFTGAVFFKSINNKLIADRLARLFPEAGIIVTIRNQYEMIESLHREHIRMGGTMSFSKFVGFNRGSFTPSYLLDDSTVNPEMFNYQKLLDYYVRLFGRDRVLVLPYEELLTDAGSFVERILSFVGVGQPPDFRNVPVNQGYGASQMRVARVLNRFLKSRLNPRGVIPAFSLPGLGRVNVKLLRRALQSNTSFRLLGRRIVGNDEIKSAIKALFHDANLELSRRFDLRLDTVYREFYF
jgi:hypothetical protein